MANKKHLDIIKGMTVKEWNIWREECPDQIPDLVGADLKGMNLERINFSGSDLTGVDLRGANLHLAYFGACTIPRREGLLSYWSSCWLEDANLSEANLTQAVFISYCYKTNFAKSLCNYTRFVDIECLHDALGLKDIVVTALNSRASIGVDTILKSKGFLPDSFLRKCGYHPTIQRALLKVEKSLPENKKMTKSREQYQSVFISCVEEDRKFAEKLQRSFQDLKINNWFYKVHLVVGQRAQDMIDVGIQKYDRMILVVSNNMFSDEDNNFFRRDSVRKEILRAKEKEAVIKEQDPRGYRVIFPVMIDDAFLRSKNDEIMFLRDNTWAVGFGSVSDTGSYKQDFHKLLDGLELDKVRLAIGASE